MFVFTYGGGGAVTAGASFTEHWISVVLTLTSDLPVNKHLSFRDQ